MARSANPLYNNKIEKCFPYPVKFACERRRQFREKSNNVVEWSDNLARSY